MPQFENLDLEALKTRARFYLASSVRALAEIDRLKQINLNVQEHRNVEARLRYKKERQRKQRARKQRENWVEVKKMLERLREENRSLFDVLEMVQNRSLPNEVQLIRNPTTGVWE